MRGLALSGGGFRATLFHLGVISYLHDVEWAWNKASKEDAEKIEEGFKGTKALSSIKYITSVSGGSILAAHLVLNWQKYTDFENEQSFNEAAMELVRFIKKDIRGRIVRRIPFNFPVYWLSVLWRKAPFVDDIMPDWMRRSPTDSLERYYHKFLYNKKSLSSISGRNMPELFLLTTNLGHEASSAAFTSKALITSDKSYASGTIPLARAVAASSAFPGMFPAVIYNPTKGPKDGLKLSDGGIYDNLGVRKFWEIRSSGKKIEEVLVSDASVEFKASFGSEFLEPITIPVKAADILFRRVYLFEEEAAQQKDKVTKNCSFTFLKLRHAFAEDSSEKCRLNLIGDYQECLHRTRTDLDAFSDLEVAALVRHGYSVAQNILNYKLPASFDEQILPRWNPVPKTRNKYALALFDADSADLEKVTKLLSKSSERKKGLFSFSDPMSYLNVLILIGLIGYFFVYPKLSDAIKIDKQDVTIEEQDGKILGLNKISSIAVPDNFNEMYGIPLETTDIRDENAFDYSIDILRKGKDKGLREIFIFKVQHTRSSGEVITAFRPIAIFAARDDAKSSLEKSMVVNPTAIDIIAFDEYCPNPLWNGSEGFYDCTMSVEALEKHGFDMILQKNLAAALTDFSLAEQKSPDYHNVSEINILLNSKKSELNSASNETKNLIWNDIYKELLTYPSGEVPEEVKRQLQSLIQKPVNKSPEKSL